jgi:hypothetical protein
MINAYSGDVSAEQIKSDNATTSGVKFQFKSSAGKNLASENPLGKNVSRLGVKIKRFHSLLLLCTAPSHNSLVPHLYVSNL